MPIIYLVAAVLLSACGTYTDGYVERTTVVSIERVRTQHVRTQQALSDGHIGRIDCPATILVEVRGS